MSTPDHDPRRYDSAVDPSQPPLAQDDRTQDADETQGISTRPDDDDPAPDEDEDDFDDDEDDDEDAEDEDVDEDAEA